MTLGSKTPHRKPVRRRLLTIAVLGLSVSLLLLTMAGTTASREKGLRLGSTTYTVEFDRDDSQDEWYKLFTWNHPTYSGWRASIASPFGVLKIESSYYPEDLFRKRLPKDVHSLSKHLASANRQEVKIAAQLLAEMKSRAVPALRELFAAWSEDVDLELNEEIAAIALSAPARSISPLIENLSATNSHVQIYSAHLLGVFGTNASLAVPALRAALETNNVNKPHFARACFEITGECSGMIPILREILKTNDGDPREKHLVLELLHDLGTQASAALPDVLTLLTAEDQTLNGPALFALSRICDDKQMVLDSVLEAIHSKNETHWSFRSYAIHSLAGLGPLGLPHLISLYKNPNWDDHYSVAQALTAVGPVAVPYLNVFSNELQSSDQKRVELACEIIASLGTNAHPAIPELTELLKSEHANDRANSAAALVRIGHCEDMVIETLIDNYVADEGLSFSFSAVTLIDLLNSNEQSRMILRKKLADSPSAAQFFSEQMNVWRYAARRRGMESLSSPIESPVIEDILRSIAPKPELKQP